MRKHFLLLAVVLIAATGTLFAQSADNEDEVIKIDRMNQNAYREGEILVKFKADGAVQMRAPRKAKFQTSQVNAVDALFEELGVDSVEQLMPRTGHKNVGRVRRAYNGKEVKVQDLSKLYRLTLKAEKAQTMHEAIDRLKAMDEVEFAEPNYIVYTMALPYDDSIPTADQQTYTAEPLYSQQWGLQAINLPALWDKPKKSTKRPVIAILDTGVDIEHPDLAANIWTNAAEANGISGQDDDANGFKDDIHGWDFINQSGVLADFNGHGTHCAGIAAAVGNNGIGITGANPDALIMPVTVMQSNGTGDVATIVKGIDYAAANGADVISMSIGGYQYSMAEEQALINAYSNAVLVAAAGNDFKCINQHDCSYNLKSAQQNGPMFPAAYSYVLGVEASSNSQGKLASFSNFDDDGPIFSEYVELCNYELRAPGVNIMSTFPGGRYKNLNGTSMACPLAAGAISRLMQCREILSPELLYADLIHSVHGNMDIMSTYNITDADRHPELNIIRLSIVDTLENGDRDERADAGETIALYPTLKNVWGTATNIKYWFKVGLDVDGYWVYGDSSRIKLLQDTAYFGKPISTYAHAIAKNPYLVKISPDCQDNGRIQLTMFATCDNTTDTLRQIISIWVENGVELGGLITEDMTLYPNVHYIVTNNLAIPAGVTLTIKPGTTLKFRGGTAISVAPPSNISRIDTIDGVQGTITYPDYSSGGRIIAKGTKDSMIVFTVAEGANTGINIDMQLQKPTSNIPEWNDTLLSFKDYVDYWEYVKFTGFDYYSGGWGNYLSIKGVFLKNCYIGNSGRAIVCNWSTGVRGSSIMYRCHYVDHYDFEGFAGGNTATSYETNYVNLNAPSFSIKDYTLSPIKKCNILPINWSNGRNVLYEYKSTPQIIVPPANYYGASTESEVRKYVLDIEKSYGFGMFDISNMYTRPIREAHGIVWKILVDGIDAQDEFELLPPIGVGTHKCEVYFNRPMDVSIAPNITFGVREPFTQHKVNENGSWSADSTTYTAYFTIDAKTVSDGYNTFKVKGAEDDEHFPIGEENWRFHMEVAAAGSMSTGLMAEAGLGKVTLTWETDEEDFADLLGYNIYRWTQDTIKWNRYYDSSCKCYVEAGWKFDTLCVNSSLLDSQDTEFVDFDVVPGKDYYYVIRQVTTSLNSYDLSNAVVARPLTAVKGDANGSMTVDVADVITEVNYITRQNPQPFIFEAADVNSDEQVNIIDVVATIDLILHPQAGSQTVQQETASYYIENGILYVESDAVLGGVQCTFAADKEQSIVPLAALNEFEKVGTWQDEDNYLFMAYSMSGKTIGIGKTALLQIGDAELTNIVLSDAQGHNVVAAPRVSQALDGTLFMPCSTKYIENGHMYIRIGEHIFDVMGQQIR